MNTEDFHILPNYYNYNVVCVGRSACVLCVDYESMTYTRNVTIYYMSNTLENNNTIWRLQHKYIIIYRIFYIPTWMKCMSYSQICRCSHLATATQVIWRKILVMWTFLSVRTIKLNAFRDGILKSNFTTTYTHNML